MVALFKHVLRHKLTRAYFDIWGKNLKRFKVFKRSESSKTIRHTEKVGSKYKSSNVYAKVCVLICMKHNTCDHCKIFLSQDAK